jgi:copper(I)-binding protein
MHRCGTTRNAWLAEVADSIHCRSVVARHPERDERCGRLHENHNNGTTADRLIGGSSNIASTFEVHEMSMDNGVTNIRLIKGGLEITPRETVEVKPGSFHVMFVGLKPLTAGEHCRRA